MPQTSTGRRAGLSKSLYVAGLQCHRLLWWRVHERDAPELVPDAATQKLFDRGNRVGEVARTYVPGGILIDVPYDRFAERLDATRAALASGAPAIYEAAFSVDNVFVAVDILERAREKWKIVEVKSSLDVKPEHMDDIAIQIHVLKGAGLDIAGAEHMHLNRECAYPHLDDLFVRTSVMEEVAPCLERVPKNVAAQLATLKKDAPPPVPTGDHCKAPYECPLRDRCWPELPEHHVSELHRIGRKAADVEAAGYTLIHEIPDDYRLTLLQSRQRDAVRSGRTVVEPGLAGALKALEAPIGYLDFETINPAIPVWTGCHPYEPVPVEFCFILDRKGKLEQRDWLADAGTDPREALAIALLDASTDARTILAYNASFEQQRIRSLAAALPRLAPRLLDLAGRLVDLLTMMRTYVYDPAFHGSFSLKAVLPALVSDLSYEGLAIADGDTASRALELLLLDADAMSAEERAQTRKDLIAYCGVDVLGMVKLVAQLRQLSASQRAQRR